MIASISHLFNLSRCLLNTMQQVLNDRRTKEKWQCSSFSVIIWISDNNWTKKKQVTHIWNIWVSSKNHNKKEQHYENYCLTGSKRNPSGLCFLTSSDLSCCFIHLFPTCLFCTLSLLQNIFPHFSVHKEEILVLCARSQVSSSAWL